SLADARREFTLLMGDLSRDAANRRGWTAGVVTLRDYQFGEHRGALLVVAAMAGMLLLLAAANVTSFTVARTIAPKHDYPLRANIGAGWRDLFRLVALETLLVYGIGLVGGLSVAGIGLPLVMSLDPETARALGPASLDWRVRAVASVVAAMLGCVSSIFPS